VGLCCCDWWLQERDGLTPTCLTEFWIGLQQDPLVGKNLVRVGLVCQLLWWPREMLMVGGCEHCPLRNQCLLCAIDWGPRGCQLQLSVLWWWLWRNFWGLWWQIRLSWMTITTSSTMARFNYSIYASSSFLIDNIWIFIISFQNNILIIVFYIFQFNPYQDFIHELFSCDHKKIKNQDIILIFTSKFCLQFPSCQLSKQQCFCTI